MSLRTPFINSKLLFGYYGVLLLICSVGAVLAYQGPLTSEAWQCWSGPGTWKRDVLRSILGAFLSTFVLFQMDVIGKKELHFRNLRRLFPEGGGEWIFFVALLCVFAFLLFRFVSSFEQNLVSREQCAGAVPLVLKERFRQIWVPYFPYLFYMLGLWIGILWPILHSLLRWIRRDIEWGNSVRMELERYLPGTEDQVEPGSMESQFDRLIVTFQSYVVRLKDIAERYLSILVAVIVSLAYEQLTPSKLTVTPEATEAGKIVMWLLIGPALIIFTFIVAIGYQRTAQRVEKGMKTFVNALAAGNYGGELLDRVMSARNELIWDRSPTEFIFGVVKSATVAMPLVIAIGGYVATMLTGNSWVEIFLPRAVIEFVKQLYQ